MNNLALKCQISCDVSETEIALGILSEHAAQSPAILECFDERFPSIEDACDIHSDPSSGPGLMNLAVKMVPNAALLSFMKDLILECPPPKRES